MIALLIVAAIAAVCTLFAACAYGFRNIDRLETPWWAE